MQRVITAGEPTTAQADVAVHDRYDREHGACDVAGLALQWKTRASGTSPP